MKPAAPRRQRCAIYTRKSTEHNLDLAFNSLDAQREACEAYIKSQAHEGWTLVRDRFDDGAFSGASLDRPALQSLLDQVQARQIDIIVVYKVDRLTRALADFAKLVELFDAHDVSFVSVTQSFNTTSSMGRLTLNVLLSFAQFEREVIGERVRDKIAASKRRGIWVGGPVPLGYRSVDKKLQVVPEEADLVRSIFAAYLRLGSLGALAAHLNASGQKPKPRHLANGSIIQANCFRVGPLAHLLKNRFYLGEVVYRGEVWPGEHEAIVERQVFEEVQQQLKDQSVKRQGQRRASPHLLTGRLFDDRGHRMSPVHANKQGIRYRYYVSQALVQGRKAEAGSVARVSALDLEAAVLKVLRDAVAREGGEPLSDPDLIATRLVRTVLHRDEIEVCIKPNPFRSAQEDTGGNTEAATIMRAPFQNAPPLRKGVVHHPDASGETVNEANRLTLLTAIACSRSWVDQLNSDSDASIASIASREGLAERHARFLLPLAFLSPRVVEAIAESRAPAGLTVTQMARALPLSWREQEARLLG